MGEPTALYNSKIKCPVCENEFEITKVRSTQVKLQKQDSDFCPHYDGQNPLYYEVVVCPNCGFASHITAIETINRYEKQKILDLISKKWVPRFFKGERTWEKALEAFKIVLLNLQCRDAAQSEVAKICIRIAWLYRYAGDSELEQRYLSHALVSYKRSYQEENLAETKLDEYTCLFIIGELSKRVGNYEESLQWFSRLIGLYADPKHKTKIPGNLIEKARDIVHELKIIDKKNKEAI